MKDDREWMKYLARPDIGLQALHAHYVTHVYERHSHDFFVIGAVDGGAPNFSVGRRRLVAPSGTAMIINPGKSHDGKASDCNGYVYSMVYVDDWVVQDLAEELGVASGSSVAFGLPVIDDPEIVRRILHLHRAILNSSNRLECETYLMAALEPLVLRFSSSASPRPAGRGNDRRVLRIREFIHEHYGDAVTTADLATASGLGRSRLNGLFRSAYGLPLHAYLNRVRLSAARDLLRSGRTAAEAAVAVGLSDQSHLIRRFRGSFGITPKQFVEGHCTNVQYAG